MKSRSEGRKEGREVERKLEKKQVWGGRKKVGKEGRMHV